MTPDDTKALIEATANTVAERVREQTKQEVHKAITHHEKDMHKLIDEKLGEKHTVEHKFVERWMERIDRMGDGFWSNIGKFFALGFLALLAMIALFTMDKTGLGD